MDKERNEMLVDRFINNEMKPDERILFCQEMEQNKDLREFVALRKLIVEGELIAAEQKARHAMEQSSTVHHKTRYQWVAACIIILLIGGGIFGHSYKYDTLYIYNTYSFIPTIERVRGEGGLKGEIADFNDNIIALYDENKYKDIAGATQNITSDIISRLPVHTSLYIVISLLETNQTQEAVNILSHLISSEYQEEIEWLQLCACLQMEKRKEAMNIAEHIIERKGQYSSKAVIVLDKINERRWF